MKKALVVAIVMVLGLGALAFAGPLTGTWDASISIDPGATQAGDLFVDLSTSLAVDYTVAAWAFGSSSTFDTIGWSAQSFTASGVLGAFTFDSTMNFKPRTVTSVVWDFNNAAGTDLNSLIDPALTVAAVAPSTIAHFSECWVTDTDYVTYGYSAAFDDWTVTGAVSIAGVSFEGLFFLEGYTGDASAAPYAFYTATGTLTDLVQTAGDATHYLGAAAAAGTTGSGFRFTASGSAGDMTITSYTYFNLSETFAKPTATSLTKSGKYTVSGCDLGFTEEYIHVEGISFGCATLEAGLDISCDGFEWVAVKASNVELFAPIGLTGSFQVRFGETSKTATLTFDALAFDATCFVITGTLNTATTGYGVTGFSINSISFSQEWSGITFSSTTDFNSFSSTIVDDANKILFMVPVTGMKDGSGSTAKNIASVGGTGAGYYDAVCVNTEEYRVWESFTISSEGDSCCGGAFTFDITTSFGDKYELDAWAYDYQFDNDTSSPTVHNTGTYLALETGDAVPTLADIVGGDADGNGVVDTIDYTDTIWASTATNKYAEQLLTGTIYEKATQDQLFQWVSTDIDVSYGLSSTWSLTFGLDIDVYGWNSLDFGFDFAF